MFKRMSGTKCSNGEGEFDSDSMEDIKYSTEIDEEFNNYESNVLENCDANAQKKFPCDICDKSYDQNYMLVRHKSIVHDKGTL